MTLATPALAQTGTIEVDGSDKHIRNNGANFYIKPAANWDADARAWRVHYSVNIDMAEAETLAKDINGEEALNELKAVKTKYANRYWFKMRYAYTYVGHPEACINEDPAAYSSEMIGGTGWSRSFLVPPEEPTCLTVWIYGDNLYSDKGNNWRANKVALGSAWFETPAAPSP